MVSRLHLLPLAASLVLALVGCPQVEPKYDHDGDGHDDAVDCDPVDATVHPGASDPFDDGIDQDCDGFDGVDRDGDGWPANPELPEDQRDCNDEDASIHPGAEEVPGDGLDNDCSGDDATDADGDGHLAGLDDCDDDDPETWLGAPEVADGEDDDCDGRVDEGTEAADDDGDGACEGWLPDGETEEICTDDSVPGDCDDSFALVHPFDGDEDGYSPCDGDCDDGDAARAPGNEEVCDGRDSDCDLVLPIDEDDLDGDGVPPCAGDCVDLDATVFPGATEACDDVDSDCDGSRVDEFDDFDGDDLPDCADPDDDDDGSLDGDDCAPLDPLRFPGNAEACDALDSDCDGSLVDEFGDVDGDGDPGCTDPDDDGDGALDAADCAPEDAGTFPGAPEVCDAVDNDCDGSVSAGFSDLDGDDLPDCVDPDADGDLDPATSDCDDADPAIHAGAPEGCDGVDTDCDGQPAPVEQDVDGDGVPICMGDCDDANATVASGLPEQCDGLDTDCDGVIPAEEVDDDGDGVQGCDGDCDDGNADVWPGAPEICDGLDDDCDGVLAPEEADADADGQRGCDGDCDDSRAWVLVGAPELCDGWDDDCDGLLGAAEIDGDGDGHFGCAWEAASGNPAWGGDDCDDADATRSPGAVEACDGIDNDCDGALPAAEIDGDGDGHLSCAGDCDDTRPTVYSGAPEWCDGYDSDCDGSLGPSEVDGDGDGAFPCDYVASGGSPAFRGGDCDDTDPSLFPGNWDDLPADGIDHNCDGFDEYRLLGADIRLPGIDPNGWAGIHVGPAGDFDGDGLADIAIGATRTLDSGRLFLVAGSRLGVPGTISLDTADVIIEGSDPTDWMGRSSASLGDLDGDGLDDLVVGAYGAGPSLSGAVYLFWGSQLAVGGTLSPADAHATWVGESADMLFTGWSTSPTGDLDGDGVPELLVGAYTQADGGANAGKAYLVTGAQLLAGGTWSLADASAAFVGEEVEDRAGRSLAGDGDADGDGQTDLLIGSHQHDAGGTDAGAVHVVFGGPTAPSGTTDLSAADIRLVGEVAEDHAGSSVAWAGDVDGDGLDDALVGAPDHDAGGPSRGAVYLVTGAQLAATTGDLSLAAAHARLDGEGSTYYMGASVAGVGDVDGDGLDDVLIGAGSGTTAGPIFLVLGADLAAGGALTEGDAAAIFFGMDPITSDVSVAGVGDVNGDGAPDLLIGVQQGNYAADRTGEAFLLLNPW